MVKKYSKDLSKVIQIDENQCSVAAGIFSELRCLPIPLAPIGHSSFAIPLIPECCISGVTSQPSHRTARPCLRCFADGF